MWCVFIGITLLILVIAGYQSNNIEEVERIYRLNLFPHGKNVLKKRWFIIATIKVNDNGSLRISGNVELVDGEGNKIETKEAFSLCRCGLSDNKPFCDGSHKSNFESVVRAE